MKHLVIDDKLPHLGGNILEGDDATFEPKLWEWLLTKYKIKSVLDVGCGCGYSTKYFRSLGCITIGLDGLLENITQCNMPAIWLDITKTRLNLDIDLVWCCEVVEHIEEIYLENLLGLLHSGKILTVTHAGIGQGGYHHVNCKTTSYWIQILESIGMQYLNDETKEARNIAQGFHFKERGLIFRRIK